jgi:hypothetical protein
MSATGQRLRLRLFLEGIEVPVIAAQITSQPNSPLQAAIQIVPHHLATKFYPRTLVHLYFLDFFEQANPLLAQRPAGNPGDPKAQDPTAYEQGKQRTQNQSGVGQAESNSSFLQDAANTRYKLCFVGEIVGFQWSKNQSKRSVVLQCLGLSNYWDYAYQFNNTDLFGPGLKALFSGGSTNLLTDFLTTPAEVITSLLHQTSIQYPALKGLLGGIVRVLESIGGSYYYEKTFSGQNVFFSLAELRLHITQCITAFDQDDTGARLLSAGGWDSLFGRVLGGLGEQVSIRDVMNSINATIFHETYDQPCPMYMPGSGGTVNGLGRQKLKNIPNLQVFYQAALGADQELTQQQQDITAPATVVGDPNSTDLLTLSQQTLQAEAEKSGTAKNSLLLRMQNLSQSLRNNGTHAMRLGINDIYGAFQAASSAINQAITLVKKNWAPGQGPGKVASSINNFLSQAQTQVQKVENLEVNTIKQSKAIPSRLQSSILRPDIWFGAPPKCNVLFPDNYHTVQFQRMFLQEPTRFLLKTNDEFFGEDELFDSFYFAPKIRTVKGQKGTLDALFNNDIFSHELFTGILPIFEKMGEFNIFAVRSGTVDSTIPKIGLAQRSTNFLYFKHRYSTRQMSISAKFNPYIAAGFPGLVIDKYIDLQSIAQIQALMQKRGQPTPEQQAFLGTHYLGDFSVVQHTIDQRQGRTDIQATFARQHDEISKFLGPIESDTQVMQQTGTVSRDTVVAALQQPPLGGVGPNFGKITQAVDVTSAYAAPSGSVATAQQLPLYRGPRDPNTETLGLLVPVGVPLVAGDLGPEITALVGSASASVTFRAFKVTEQVPQYRSKTVDIPPEEYIRPGWYGDVWRPQKIGQTYQFYFNTGSVVDANQLSLPQGISQPGAVDPQTQDAISQASNATSGDNQSLQNLLLLTLQQGATIEQAVDFLVTTYSYAKIIGAGIDKFTQTYTWRPIATMVDMFGSSDLKFSPDGSRTVSGVEGFHSRAFGPYDDLFTLVTPSIESILGIKKTSVARQTGDVRGPRFRAVADYVTALQFSRGLLG